MNSQPTQKRGTFRRVLDSSAAFGLVALALVAFLVAFYVFLNANMGNIDSRTEDLREHPYAVTVAAGRVETLVMQVKTLDDRLAFTYSQETVESVREEFASIDQQAVRELDIIDARFLADPDLADQLQSAYREFVVLQNELISLSEGPAGDEEIARFLEESIDPSIDELIRINTLVIEGASQSFDHMYDIVSSARRHTMATAALLLGVFVAALLLFMVVLMHKNRQQRELRESLHRAVDEAQRANLAKSRFLSNVSHDIRTPITAIIGLTNIAADHADEQDRVRESLRKVQVSSHHLLNLVNDVLDMSKIESGQIDLAQASFRVADVMDTAAAIVRPQAEARGITLQVESAAVDAVKVTGDEMRVRQVLINLLANSMKYTDPEGLVRCSAAILPCQPGEDEGAEGVERAERTGGTGGVGRAEGAEGAGRVEGAEGTGGVEEPEGVEKPGGAEGAEGTERAEESEEHEEPKDAERAEGVEGPEEPEKPEGETPFPRGASARAASSSPAVSGSVAEEGEVVVRFVVEDNGIGMTPEFVARIFEPFEREEGAARFMGEGTGLGMSIVKSLVEAMGGAICVDSARGEGSRFTVDVPFAAGVVERRQDGDQEISDIAASAEPGLGQKGSPSGASGGSDRSPIRILLVEDNEIVGEIAEELIQDAGASVERAWNGLEAVAAVAAAPEGHYDIVFMDIQMPRMDGLEAARAITDECRRQKKARPPIIAMTANAYVEDRQRAFEAGMDGYAVKPIGRDDIERLLNVHVRSDARS